MSSYRGSSGFVFSPHHSFGAPTEEALPYLVLIGVCFLLVAFDGSTTNCEDEDYE